jgi:prolyl 4-hydroxylase
MFRVLCQDLLTTHVCFQNRLPLVLSAIINVAQDVEEDWPLEIVGHDGIPVNVTMQPGDMILYESHSILHGRPYPLQGNYFANVFVHFEPLFYSMNLEQEIFQKDNQSTNRRADEATLLRQKYEQALSQWDESNAVSPGTKRQDLPLHIQEGSLEATRWRQEFVFVKEETPQKSINNVNEKNDNQKTHNINRLAARGALDAIRELAQTDPAILQQRDANHWQAIHEAARAGQTQVVEYLIHKGVDLNTRTNNGNGGTALWWAEHVSSTT